MKRSSRVDPADAARLHMSLRNNPMVIAVVLQLQSRLDHDVLVSLLKHRLGALPQFSQRVVTPRMGLGLPRWQTSPDFDFDAHIEHLSLPAGAVLPDLEERVGALISAPLRSDRPLWQMHHIAGVEGGSALVLRIHHCMGDGAKLASTLRAIADEAPHYPAPDPPRARPRLTSTAVVRRVAAFAVGARLALGKTDPPSLLRGPLGQHKRVAFTRTLPLSELRRGAHRRGASLTALLLAAVAQGIERWQRAHSVLPPAALHALVPVSLRGRVGSDAHNSFASISVRLPMTGVPELRLGQIGAELAQIAHGDRAFVGAKAIAAAGLAAPWAVRLAARHVSRRASVVVSSVAGPSERLYLGGVELRDVFVCVPPPGDIALSVAFVSHAGRASLSVLADARVIGDAHSLSRLVDGELRALVRDESAVSNAS